MKTNSTCIFNTPLEEDVYKGLLAFPKKLSSKFFYDETGDKLFQQIMEMPEYYLTRCEYQILEKEKKAICDAFDAGRAGFDLIELGAGDGIKTKILLRQLITDGHDFCYKPVDISQHALDELETSLLTELPTLSVEPQQGTYFEILEKLSSFSSRKKIIMFLGSNLGNMTHSVALRFLQNIQKSMNPGDLLFMGLDMKKDPQTILDAYNDAAGITAAFNKNLLIRINRELGADFNPDLFKHWEAYNPETGTAKSYLVAMEAHAVNIKSLELQVHFKQWETIHTETSQKYDETIVNWLSEQSGLSVTARFTDSDNYFTDYLFNLIS